MKICIYGAAKEEIADIYKDEARKLGNIIGKNGHTLIFGGGNYGMMGAVAKGVKESGGRVIGISPRYIQRHESLFKECDDFFSPETLQERKQMFERMSDAFIVLPGGIGTLDEFFEALSEKSHDNLKKKICIYNINGYYNDLNDMIKNMVSQNFVSEYVLKLYEIFSDSDNIINYLQNK